MAWPFSKPKLKVPQPQASKTSKPAYKVSFSSVMTGEHKKLQEEFAENNAKIKDTLNVSEKTKKNLDVLEKEFDEHREEMMDEIKSINKNLGPLYDKDTELEKDIKELGLMDKKLLSEIAKVERKAKDAKDIVENVESVFSPEAIRKLKLQLIEANNSAKLVESNDLRALKKLQNIDRRIGVVAKHAETMGAEKEAMQQSAEALAQHAAELKETIGGYSDQLVELSGKVSANIAKTADIDAEVHAILHRLESAESQISAVTDISRAMQEQSALLAQIARRLEYLEKTTVKTVVLE